VSGSSLRLTPVAANAAAAIVARGEGNRRLTGGLPRVVERFEARKPRETAVISAIDVIVKHGGIVKGQRKIIILPEDGGESREYFLPPARTGAHHSAREDRCMSALPPRLIVRDARDQQRCREPVSRRHPGRPLARDIRRAAQGPPARA
jgi:hypothetical protein